jgi:predicted acyltransferase
VKQRRPRRLIRSRLGRFARSLRRNRKLLWLVVAFAILLTLSSRILIAYYLANDAPGDGVVYARLAKNMLEQGVFSIEEEAPYSPTLIRMPGYPLFIAGVYSIFGHDNNAAVRIVQAVFDTGTCVLVALVAGLWTEKKRRKWQAPIWAFALVAICPFIAIYSATILTETLTTFLMAAMTLTATLALSSERSLRSALLWTATGVLAGVTVLLRPDAGLFAAGIGLTLVITGLFLGGDVPQKLLTRLFAVGWKGGIFSLAFLLVLTPWTVRNWRLFGVFQPLAPAHAEMPGEFVAFGYLRWVRTWVDDSRFTEPMLWNLDDNPIRMSSIPAKVFDTPAEKEQVAALLDAYNNPPGSNNKQPAGDDSNDGDQSGLPSEDGGDSSDEVDPQSDADQTSTDEPDSETGTDSEDEDANAAVKMTPGIDAQFGQIAEERIARSPARYYAWLPAKRSAALWFDSHSLYWPFGGQMSPISDLDYDVSQQWWLPLFTFVTWLYTLGAIAGAVIMWRNESMRRWLILLALMSLPRIAFFATLENPEPRYAVELFAFTAILGGMWLGNRGRRRVARRELGSDRLVSLDVFRGITIAAMTLVNSPGTWAAVYPPLLHAEWNGATPTDWIFPFFLFIVGVSIAAALGKVRGAATARPVYFKIVRRAAVLFGLGLFLEVFPFYNIWTASWFEPSEVRIMGILQRIAICYAIAASIYLHTRWKAQAAIIAAILLGYWALMTLITPPGCDAATFIDTTCNLAGYVDHAILGQGHIRDQSKVVDPEGLLSTLPAIGTTLLGVLAGQWIKTDRDKKVIVMLAAGCGSSLVGWIWSFWFPLNKTLWTSSYVLYMAGLATIFLGAFYWLIDMKGYKKWATPFVILGTNAIALYVGSSLLGKTLSIVELEAANDTTQTLQERIFSNWFLPLGSPANASLLYATAFVLVWFGIMWLLYRKRIFLKV